MNKYCKTQNLSFRYDAGACMQFCLAIGYQNFMTQHQLIFVVTKVNTRYIILFNKSSIHNCNIFVAF